MAKTGALGDRWLSQVFRVTRIPSNFVGLDTPTLSLGELLFSSLKAFVGGSLLTEWDSESP